MKKNLAICGLILLFSSVTVKAQTPLSISVHGGYSWVIGGAGADIQFGRFAVGGGWMPTKMPLSDERLQAICGSLTYYQPIPVLKGLSAYISAGGATNAYRYEDSWGWKSAKPMVIGIAGGRYELGRFWLRAGGGYGWCKEGDAYTWEACLGFKVFQN